jgi:hypothetical protein
VKILILIWDFGRFLDDFWPILKTFQPVQIFGLRLKDSY